MGCCISKKNFSHCQDAASIITIIQEKVLNFKVLMNISIENRHEGELQAFQTVIHDSEEIIRELTNAKEIDFNTLNNCLDDFYQYFDEDSIKGKYRELKGNVLDVIKNN